MPLPDLSRFELQCLRHLWSHEQATVREIHAAIDDAPTYSTVRKIFERLEEKGAVRRVRKDGQAWVYRSTVTSSSMIQKEIRTFINGLFGGSAAPLMAHLADMNEVSLDDLREIERRLAKTPPVKTKTKAVGPPKGGRR